VLSGINFGSATVVIEANNVTIKDCSFSDTTSFWAINDTASGATVENCTFTGSKSPTEKNIWISSSQDITIEDNSFLNSPEDAIAIQQGLVTGNYFSGEGYNTGAHGDAIYVPETTGPITITDNFLDETLNAGATGLSNTTMRITDEFGNTNDVTVTGNYMIGAGFNFEVVAPNANYTVSNVSITNNDVGFAWYSPYMGGTTSLATVSGLNVVDFTNPTDSTNALAAYVAAGVPTATNSGAGATGSGPITELGNGVVLASLGAAGSSETNFVGGYGQQICLAVRA
jgi:Right handed beta helix region